MKKIVLTVIAMLSMTMTMNAENENANTADAYNITCNIKSLARYLELDKEQTLDVADITESLTNALREAANADESEREALVKDALKKNCKYMRNILNWEQYDMYLRALNLTLVNRGIIVR